MFQASNYNIQLDVHRNKSIIGFRFGINANLLAHLKLHFKNVLWSQSKRFWYVVASAENKALAGLHNKEFQLNSRINAIKFYFEQVLKQSDFMIDIPRPKKPSTLPKVINDKDIKKLFEVTENLKHRLMLKLCYGMGLRVSEIVNLKIIHIAICCVICVFIYSPPTFLATLQVAPFCFFCGL